MYNYHADLVWKVNVWLFIIFITFVAVIVFYLLIKEYSWRRRKKALLRIKRDVYELVFSGEKTCKIGNTALAVGTTPQQFLDITTNRNRELIFFNESEQEAFKECFFSPKEFAKIERTAVSPINKWRRIEAILALGYAVSDLSLRALRKTIFDKDDDVSYFSIIALGQIKDISSAKILLDFFKKNSTFRYKIVSILETFPKEINSEVVKLLDSNDSNLRFWALKLLAVLKTKDIEKIKTLLNDSIPEVRAAGCECLGKIGDKSSRGALEARLDDDSWLVRIAAAKALSDMLKDDCIPKVIKLVGDGSLSVTNSLKGILAEHIITALPYIDKILSGDDEMAKKICIEALESSGYILKLFNKVLSEDTLERESAIHLLNGVVKSHAHFGIESALEALTEDKRLRLLEIIKKIDSALANHIELKLNNQITEP